MTRYIGVCINPFAPGAARVHVLSTTACDIISFNGQGQLCTKRVLSEEIFQTIPD